MELSNILDLFISALLSLIFSIFIVAKVFDNEINKIFIKIFNKK